MSRSLLGCRLAILPLCLTLALALGMLFSPGFVSTARAGVPARTAAWGFDAPVHALAVFNGTLVAGGEFDHVGGVSARNLASWDGQIWSPFEPNLNGTVRSLLVHAGELVVGGDFTAAGTIPLDHIARYTSSGWQPVSGGTDGPVLSLIERSDYILYAAGNFQHAGNVAALSIARWAGNTWTPAGSGLAGDVRAMTLYGGSLVAAGGFTIPGYTIWQRFVGRFNGFNTWYPMVNGITGDVSSLANYRGSLVIGGSFSQADFVTPANSIARLDGDTWSSLNVGFWNGHPDSVNLPDVKALHTFGDSLYAGGTFTHADGQLVNHVAVWDGSGWSPLSQGMNGVVLAISDFQGAVIAAGDFTEADGKPVNYGAQFWKGAWYPLVDVIAVEVEDLQAASAAGAVHLTWRLSESTQRDLQGIEVERAEAASGPFVRCTSAALDPARDMSFDDAEVQGGKRYWYRLQLLGRDGRRSDSAPVSILAVGAAPSRSALHAPYEIAAGGSVWIGYSVGSVSSRTPVRLDIYDARGRVVRSLESSERVPGEYVRSWDRRDEAGARAARGMYFVHLRAGPFAATRKLSLLH